MSFTKVVKSNKIELANDNQTITKIYNGSWYNTSYGHQTINPCKDKEHYKWLIKIIKLHITAERLWLQY